jgi:hypothetical protein
LFLGEFASLVSTGAMVLSVAKAKPGSFLGIPEQFNENNPLTIIGIKNLRLMVDCFGFRENARIFLIV